MSHIFISYSRKDLAFAQKIVNALADNDLDTWIDWKSIPKGEDWEQEIYRGIEEADAFLFLISTDSVISEPCNIEIAHAVKNGKRILPVFITNVEDKEVYNVTGKFTHNESKEEINRRNFIFCREEKDDFNKAIEEIETTIHTDYEWLKYHTILQNKALAWERKQKDNSRLLRGKELREAEEQQAGGNRQNDPQPTNLQREYLLYSRKREDRQRRRLIFGLGIATLVLLGIAITAVWQWRIAVEQTRIARTSELSARALNLRDQQFDLALLLAVEAYKTIDMQQTKTALDLVRKEHPALIQFFNNPRYINAVAWSPDGRLASASQDVIIWDVETGEPSQKLIYSNSKMSSIGITALAWSANNDLLAAGAADGAVVVWDVKKDSPTYGEPIHILRGHTDGVESVAWSNDGLLASSSNDKSVIKWDLTREQPESILMGHEDWVLSVAWSSDGQLASGGRDNIVIVWDLKTKRPSQILRGHNDWVINIAWSPNSQLASADGFFVILWDLDLGQPARTLQYGPRTSQDYAVAQSIAWSPNGRLASGSRDGRVFIWNLQNGSPSQILQSNQAGINSIAWSPDEKLVSGGDDGTMILWEPFSWQPILNIRSESRYISSVAWSREGQLASGSQDGTVTLWDIEVGKPAKILQGHTGNVNSLAWSEDGRLASGSSDNTIIIWDLENNTPDFILHEHTSGVISVAWSTGGQLASGSSNGDIFIWDLDEKSTNFLGPSTILHNQGVYGLGWSPDGQLASSYYEISVWDPVNSVLKKILPMVTLPKVNSIVWISESQLAAGHEEGEVTIWDIEKGDLQELWSRHSSSVNTLAWSPNEQLLASGSNDHTVILWNLTKSFEPVQILQSHSGEVNSVAWSMDGRLASGANDGTIIIWAFSSGRSIKENTFETTWLNESCQRAGRNLTKTEWAQYLSWKAPFDPAYRTCPQWPAGE